MLGDLNTYVNYLF